MKIHTGFRIINDNIRQIIPKTIKTDEKRWIPSDLKMDKTGILDKVETIIHSPMVNDDGAYFIRTVKTNKLRNTDIVIIVMICRENKFTVEYGRIEYDFVIIKITINDKMGVNLISNVGTPSKLSIKSISKIIDTIIHI